MVGRLVAVPGGKCGDGCGGLRVVWVPVTVLWFEGRMLRDGEVGAGGGGI
jgi:hypothetical protein